MKKRVSMWQYLMYACAAIMLLCGLMFILSSCVEIPIDPGSNNDKTVIAAQGRDGNLNFKLNFDDYGESEDISLRNAEDLKAETVVIPLDDGLSMYATLQPAARGVAKRSTELRAFALNTRIYIVAYKQISPSTYNYEHHVGFHVEQNALTSDLTRDAMMSPFVLSVGSTYRFVAYTFNDIVTTLPAVSFPTTMNITDIDNRLDLIWGSSGDLLIGSGVNDVLISMNHKFSRVRIDAVSSVGNITDIKEVKMYGYTADLDVEDGSLTIHSDSTMSFSGFSIPGNTNSVSSARRIVYTAGVTPTIVHVGSVSIAGTPYADLTATFAKRLLSGYDYDLKLQIGDADDLTDDLPPTGFTPYVGAFWKYNQRGERLIRMERPSSSTDADGVWSATVVKGADWIVLDTLRSADVNVLTSTGPSISGNDAGFETATYYLPGNAIHVSGVMSTSKPEIYFRIGLKYILTNPTDHRYGIVLLTYGDNQLRQRIWIRQGEAPDYLMYDEPISSGGMVHPAGTKRPDAVKFAVYNLKDPVENTGTTGPSTRQIGVRGGVFTDYPTQAGYFFQWAGSVGNTTRAYNPYTNDISSFPGHVGAGVFWNTLAIDNETCPPGYRRPNDGVTNATIPMINTGATGSEFRQSLYLNPQMGENTNSDNYVYGYYADGFFDRRKLENAPGINNPGTGSSVSAGGVRIAHQGGLVFNPITNASLFFPAVGSRGALYKELIPGDYAGPPEGTLNLAGTNGYYWSSSTWIAFLARGNNNNFDMVQTSSTGWYAYPIRCVVDVCVPATSVSISSSAVSATVGSSVVLTATPVPSNANNLIHQWEYSIDGGMTWTIAGVTGATYNAPAMIVGVTRYRVTVSNSCSTPSVSPAVSITGSGIETNPTLNIYAGAYWKANQRAERLIRIERPPTDNHLSDGLWKAVVIDGAGWIVLDKNPSPDNGVWTPGGPNISGNDSGFESGTYNVSGSATSVSGTLRSSSSPDYQSGDEYIYFRIGLNSTIAATSNRYGMVLLTYNNGQRSHRIWIRQGENPDYLAHTDIPNSSIPTDPEGQRISPYNLTAPAPPNYTDPNTILTGPPAYPWSVGLPIKGGVFTDYPSQAGYYFSFSQNRQAFAPHWPSTIPTWTEESMKGIHTTYYNFDSLNVCPPGNNYRRPELRYLNKILYTHPKDGNGIDANENSVWGYYADGFFDRREITNSSTVADATRNVAYTGRLFISPDNNGSVFFPAAGYRSYNNGILTGRGTQVRVWTMQREDDSHAWHMAATQSATNLSHISRSYGFTVRCLFVRIVQ